MANDAGAEFILPVHHQTFQLSREPRLEPIHRILQAAGSATERVLPAHDWTGISPLKQELEAKIEFGGCCFWWR